MLQKNKQGCVQQACVLLQMARVKKAGPGPKPRPTSKMSSSTVRYITMLKKGKCTYMNYKQRKPTSGGLTESDDDDSRIRSVNEWSEADMQQAIEGVFEGGVGLRFVARAWRVPKSTLERRVKGKVTCHKHMLGKKTAFTEAEETELEEFLLDMARCGFPLTESDIRDLAFQCAKKNNMKVFSDDKRVCISEALCFLKHNFDKLVASELRSTLVDFYNDDELPIAKGTLLSVVSKVFRESNRATEVPRLLKRTIHFLAKYNPPLQHWLEKHAGNASYLSPGIQNQLIKVLYDTTLDIIKTEATEAQCKGIEADFSCQNAVLSKNSWYVLVQIQ